MKESSLYSIFSKIAPVLILFFVTSPHMPEYLQKEFGVNVMANYVWTLALASLFTFGYSFKSAEYWHAKERGFGKVYYHAALMVSSFLAIVISVSLLQGLFGGNYRLFKLIHGSSPLLALQTISVILIIFQMVVPKISKEQASRFIFWYEARFKKIKLN